MSNIPGGETVSHGIGPKTLWGGLIGQGISHTLSPFIHNFAAHKLGLDAVYLPFDLKAPPTQTFFEALAGSNVFGFNITLPYKEIIARQFPESGLDSCNTLIHENGLWRATSTDAEGFLIGLKQIGKDLSDFEAVICLGYGGAAKALLSAFKVKNPHNPHYVLLRSFQKDSPHQRPFEAKALEELLKMHPNSLLIQCTSAPLKGERLEAFIPALHHLEGAFVDLVYGYPSALLEAAQMRKIPSQDGLPMLIGQALASERLWWGTAPEYSLVEKAVNEHLSKQKRSSP